MTRLSALLICLLPSMSWAAGDFTCHSEYVKGVLVDGLRTGLADSASAEDTEKLLAQVKPQFSNIVVQARQPSIDAIDCAATMKLDTSQFNWERLKLAQQAFVGQAVERAMYGVPTAPTARPDRYTAREATWNSVPYRVQRSSDGSEILVDVAGLDRSVEWLSMVVNGGALNPAPLPKATSVGKTPPDPDSVTAWQQTLVEHISRHWTRVPGLASDLRCQLIINLQPSGQVSDVRVLKSSGSPAFDDSVRTAVLKASPLPLPADPKAFDRVLKPTFTPEMLE